MVSASTPLLLQFLNFRGGGVGVGIGVGISVGISVGEEVEEASDGVGYGRAAFEVGGV